MKVQNHIQVKGKMCFIIIIKVYQSKKNARESEKGKQKYEDVSQLIYCLYSQKPDKSQERAKNKVTNLFFCSLVKTTLSCGFANHYIHVLN